MPGEHRPAQVDRRAGGARGTTDQAAPEDPRETDVPGLCQGSADCSREKSRFPSAGLEKSNLDSKRQFPQELQRTRRDHPAHTPPSGDTDDQYAKRGGGDPNHGVEMRLEIHHPAEH